MFEQVSDARLLARYARRGDPAAFAALSERYHPMVLATCERALGNRADAEDVAQETFLKLAQHAGRVKSNVAAWLHRCATRACVDLVRKRGSDRRAESRASGRALASDASERAWRELEPELDAALAELPEKERNWIIARFMTGRTNAELARAEGVSAGTMHRRVEKALKKLRASMASSGLVLVGGVSLSAVLAHAAPAPGSAAALPVAKLALAGTATTARVGVLSVATVALVAGAAIGVAAVGGGAAYVALGSGGEGAPGANVVTEAGEPVVRPTKQTKGFPLIASTSDNMWYETMRWEGDRMSFRFSPDRQSPRRVSVDMRVLDRSGGDDKGTMSLLVERSDAGDQSEFTALVGKTFGATYEVDKIGRLWLTATIETPEGEAERTWIGARPIRARGDRVAGPTDENPMSGDWVEVSDWYLTMDKDNVRVGNPYFTLYRFRILEWEEGRRETRVRAIVADSVIPGYVGDRVRLILRKDEHGYLLAHHEPDSENADAYPTDFNPERGDDLRVLRFSEVTP